MEYIKRLIQKYIQSPGRKTYAQYGEDVIIDGIFTTLGRATPHYIDIGTHHATNLSNTYFFYKKGSSGVCIEPSPVLAKKVKVKRPRDIVRAVGVGKETTKPIPYYILTAQTMNTFSKEDAMQTIQSPEMYGSQKIETTLQIPVVGINEILNEYGMKYGDFISIDTEGMDEEIIAAIDFSICRPVVFCIETISQKEDGAFYKNTAIHEILRKNGYMEYADTYVNTIFVDTKVWKN